MVKSHIRCYYWRSYCNRYCSRCNASRVSVRLGSVPSVFHMLTERSPQFRIQLRISNSLRLYYTHRSDYFLDIPIQSYDKHDRYYPTHSACETAVQSRKVNCVLHYGCAWWFRNMKVKHEKSVDVPRLLQSTGLPFSGLTSEQCLE